jgi:hypothetical protein
MLIKRVTMLLSLRNYLLTPKRYAKDIRNIPPIEFI